MAGFKKESLCKKICMQAVEAISSSDVCTDSDVDLDYSKKISDLVAWIQHSFKI
jgi:hypothetical protein